MLDGPGDEAAGHPGLAQTGLVGDEEAFGLGGPIELVEDMVDGSALEVAEVVQVGARPCSGSRRPPHLELVRLSGDLPQLLKAFGQDLTASLRGLQPLDQAVEVVKSTRPVGQRSKDQLEHAGALAEVRRHSRRRFRPHW